VLSFKAHSRLIPFVTSPRGREYRQLLTSARAKTVSVLKMWHTAFVKAQSSQETERQEPSSKAMFPHPLSCDEQIRILYAKVSNLNPSSGEAEL
jgi:hypothetical protein